MINGNLKKKLKVRKREIIKNVDKTAKREKQGK
jgi:hypothetical protein